MRTYKDVKRSKPTRRYQHTAVIYYMVLTFDGHIYKPIERALLVGVDLRLKYDSSLN